MSYQGVRPSLSRSGQLSQFRSARLGVTMYDLQLRKVITPSSELRFGCSWTQDSMESPLSQEFIHLPEEDRRCHTEVSDRVYRGQVRSVNSGQLNWV